MSAVAILALQGSRVVSVRPIRSPFAAVIGVAIGGTVSPVLVSDLPQWVPLTLAVVVSTALTGAAGSLFLRRVAGMDWATAYSSAMPAGVYEMTVQGEIFGADVRRVARAQAMRIFLVVLTVPMVFRWLYTVSSGTEIPLRQAEIASLPQDWAALLACAVVGWLIARRLHFPNAAMLGPMILSALLHGSGLVEAVPPVWLLAVAQDILGASIGGQFAGATPSGLRRSALQASVLVPMALSINVAVALVLGHATSLDLATCILALAPGGSVEMSIIALAVGAEVTAVVFHQVLRVLLVHGLASAVFQWLR